MVDYNKIKKKPFRTVSMKNLTVLLFLNVVCSMSVAQKVELGGFISGFMYKGEYNQYPNPLNIRPGLALFVRQNFNPVSTLRYGIAVGNIHGSDQGSEQPMNILRNKKFNNSILEGSILYEYNFFDFRENEKTFKKSSKWSPYLCGGLGFFISNSIVKNTRNGGLCLPVGFGFKHKINKNWNFGAEGLIRKTFIDGLDGVDLKDNAKPQISFTSDKDWYLSVSLFLSYSIYRIYCPK